MKTNFGKAGVLVLICAASTLTVAAGAQEEAERGGLLPYSNDAVRLDDGLNAQIAAFSASLPQEMQLTAEQQARTVQLLREERVALARSLPTAPFEANLQRRALEKGVALNETSLQLMQHSLQRLLTQLTAIMSSEQRREFVTVEQQKLDAQRRFLEERATAQRRKMELSL